VNLFSRESHEGILEAESSEALCCLRGSACLFEQCFPGIRDLPGKLLLTGQGKLILAGENLVVRVPEGVVRDRFVFFRAQD
jgi:hypothetical protein